VGDEVHISSLVVHSRPERARAVADRLRGMAGVDVHGGTEAGKLVVTLETASEDEIVERLGGIQALEGVLAATLVFHHFEPAQRRG
jgi:periplasmic nitrate reductase NapD